MVQYEVCWPMGSASTGRAPQQLTGSPFKYLKKQSGIKTATKTTFLQGCAQRPEPIKSQKLGTCA